MRALRGHYPPRTLVHHASSACFLRHSDCLGPEQIDCWRCHHPSLAGCDLGSEGMSGHLQKRQDRTAARAIASLRCSTHSFPAVTPIHCPVPQAISFSKRRVIVYPSPCFICSPPYSLFQVE